MLRNVLCKVPFACPIYRRAFAIAPAKLQYPPPSGSYKVLSLGKSTWQGQDNVRLFISIGSLKTDGEKLFALTEWATARFDRVTFIIGDTLQRHNVAINAGFPKRMRTRSRRNSDRNGFLRIKLP